MADHIHTRADGPAAATGCDAGRRLGGQVDATLFLALSDRLRAAFAVLGTAGLPQGQHARWRKRLIAITDAARHDLGSAAAEMDRYEDDFRRATAA